MPNKKGGKKFKKGKKQSSYDKALLYKDPKEDQEYAKVIRASGNGRFDVQCFDGKDRLGVLAGNMRKKIWVNKDDIILISKWEFLTDDTKCSIIHKYDNDEVKKLKRDGEFPECITLETESEFADFGDQDDMITFDYNDPDESSSDEELSEPTEEIDLDDI